MSSQNFVKFLELVAKDPSLQRQLTESGSAEAFTATAVALGGQHGCTFSPEEVEGAMARWSGGAFEPGTEMDERELSTVAGGLTIKSLSTSGCQIAETVTCQDPWSVPSTSIPYLCTSGR